MFDDLEPDLSLSRRQFLADVSSLATAAAFSLQLPEGVAAQVTNDNDSATQTVSSPDGSITFTMDVSEENPSYRVDYGGRTVIEPSTLGFEFQNQSDFSGGVTVTGSERSTVEKTWTPVWDRYDEIREQYEELRLGLAETGETGRSLTVEVRVFDDGVGFRYVFPEDGGFGDFVVSSERTEFTFGGDYTSWWIPNDFDSYEYEYNETALSEIGSQSSFGGAHTPITMRADEDLYLSVHEANLIDYGAMAVQPASEDGPTFESALAPLPDGTKVSASAPHQTPWRTIQVGERPGDLIESNLIVNLNEDHDPSEFPHGTEWIQPQKFVGVWWLMITGRADWEFQGPETGNHGAQTRRVKRYMDFASEHDIPGVLVEGWNRGWSSYPDGGGDAFDFTEPYTDFDLEEVTSYGSDLTPTTQLTMHNETAGGFRNYESQIDEAFGLYDELGNRTIKNGYVNDDGDLAGEGHNHHNQVMVNHHHVVAKAGAENRQMLEIHEPVHPTGRRRTYPNLMTREGVYGQEYDSFGDISPSHHVTFPFTRMLGGPVEFTPGVFDMDSGSGGVETTRAKQLAMYPTYFSGLQMVADLVSSYLANQPATLAVGEVTQAEFADLDDVPTGASWAGAQGERYVEVDLNDAGVGATITWSVDSVEAGEYDLHLRYASDTENNAVPPEKDRTATITVDGEALAQVTFPTTDYWDVWDTVSATVTVDVETETIGVTLGEDDTGGFNLDAVALTQPGVSMPDPETAPIRGPTVDGFEFVEAVPAAGWDDTRVLDSSIGEYIVTARRKDDEWYLGAMTDEGGRVLDVDLEFLEDDGPGTARYVAEIYSDAIDASYDERPEPIRIDEAIVTPETTLLASMVGSGGTAVRIRPATDSDVADLPEYRRPDQDIDVSIDSETYIREQFITATGSNDSDYIGGTTVELRINGDIVSTSNVRLAPTTTDTSDDFSYVLEDPGTYGVSVRTPTGETLANETVTVDAAEPVAFFDDPLGDDHGPGEYTYPTADAYHEGAFDISSVAVAQTPSLVRFTVEVENLFDVWGGRFSPHMFVFWIRDPEASGGSTESLDDLDANVAFEQPWHYRLHVSGWDLDAVDASGATLTDGTGSTLAPRPSVDFETGTVTLDVDRDAFGGTDPTDMELCVAVGSEEYGAFRPVQEEAGGHRFGGATPGAVDNAPLLMDVITPNDVSQTEALAYSTDGPAELPFVPIADGRTVTVPGADGPAGNVDDDPYLEDVDGDGKATVTDVWTLFENLDSQTVETNPFFDFDGDGSVTISDVLTLFRKIL